MRRVVMTVTFGLAIALLTTLAVFPVSANSPGGTVNYFTVKGTGSSAKCTSTPWTPVGMDGNIGFGGNLGGPQNMPIVSNGELICIKLILTGQSPSTSYKVTSTGSTASLSPVVSGNNTFSTDGSGDVNIFMIFLVSTSTGSCGTNPIKISPSVSGTASTGNQIGHDLAGSGCSTTVTYSASTKTTPSGVPEFPIAGSLGLLLVVAIAVPLLVAARKWRSPIQVA